MALGCLVAASATELDPNVLAAFQYGERWVYVVRMAFNTRITIGPEYSAGWYDDCWCYETIGEAFLAAVAWNPDAELEPSGWVKHPRSGRRRPGGDAAQEYVWR